MSLSGGCWAGAKSQVWARRSQLRGVPGCLPSAARPAPVSGLRRLRDGLG